LRRELPGPVPVLARGFGLVFTVPALIMYARWLARRLDLGLAVARHDARLPEGNSFCPEIAIAAAVAVIAQALAWGDLAGFVFWRRSRDLFGIFNSAGFRPVGIIGTDLDVIVARLAELEAAARRPDENPMPYLLAIAGRGERRGDGWRAAERIRKLHGVAVFSTSLAGRPPGCGS
jgi:hypothetical protein